MAGFVGLVRRKCLKVDRHREQISNDLFDKAEGHESLWTLLLLKLTDTWRQVENHARRLRRIENQTMEGLDINEADFQQLLDELTDAKKNVVQHTGHLPRNCFLELSSDGPDHVLEDHTDLPLLEPDVWFKKQGNRTSTDTNVGRQRVRWKRTRRSERAYLEGPVQREATTLLEMQKLLESKSRGPLVAGSLDVRKSQPR